MLPLNWQDNIVETRSRIESHWRTPNLGACARFIAEEATELLSVMNRLANPELLRSTPLEDKDRPQREIGQVLCMVGSLANSLGVRLKPERPSGKTKSAMTAVAWLNFLCAEVAYAVTAAQEIGDSENRLVMTVGHSLDVIAGQIIEVGDLLGIDPYEALVDWLDAIEAKVEKIRSQELEAAA